MTVVLDRIAEELKLPRAGVAATVALFEEGNTVPFIARYRKEATGSLDEVAIRDIEERFSYYKELLERRAVILKSIEEQGRLTEDLKNRIESTWVKAELEDLYLPFKPKKRTKATIARERGLEPLLEALLQDATGADPFMVAASFVKEGEEGLSTPSECIEGAGHILAEMLAENADIRAHVRQVFHDKGVLVSTIREEKKESSDAIRFRQYFDFKEAIAKIPSHRLLALRRGEKEDVLSVKLVVEERDPLIGYMLGKIPVHPESGYRKELFGVCADAFERLLAPSIETEVRIEAKRKADAEAIKVFQTNLQRLLLAPPAGQRCTLGVDPGIRTGCKLAVVNRIGRFMETDVIYPLEPKRDIEGSRAVLERLATAHPLEAIVIGNGTGGREVEAFVKDWLHDTGRRDVVCIMVSEAGASVYSASDVAREEFPDQDVTVRGAISIARRFQDPLAELVKVEPKSIGVGQYQHDVNQGQLKKGLDDVVETSVNYVGVELNTASFRLLGYVAGIGESLAKNIVNYRNEHGPFKHREELMNVTRFGEKAFLQAAGFLRIREGENPLDASAVHPESYGIVQRISQLVGLTVPELIGNDSVLDSLDPVVFVDERFGVETVKDILAELKKPGRDPRKAYVAVQFRADVNKPEDLVIGMELEGVVTNVTDFGAFVDVGVHQDGLVHLSEISHKFVKNPSEMLSVGQIVKVKVIALDLPAKRIGLSIKALQGAPGGKPERPTRERRDAKPEGERPRTPKNQRPARESERPQKPKTVPAGASLEDLVAKFSKGLR